MSKSLQDYRIVLLEHAQRINESNKPSNGYLSETMQLARDATDFFHLLLETAIAAGVTLTVLQGQMVVPASIQDLRKQCCDLAEQLNQADMELAQQVQVALKFVGCIAHLVRLESDRVRQRAEAGVHPSLANLHKN
jgi:hypothetical protein